VAQVKRETVTSKPTKKAIDDNPVSEVVGLVKTYAKQEALDPLVNALRWLGYGAAGAVCLAIGLSLGLLGLLRLLQTETGDLFDGNWSWVPYLITLVAAGIVLAIVVSRIKKPTLDKGEWSMTEQRVTATTSRRNCAHPVGRERRGRVEALDRLTGQASPRCSS
jgi:hypothetical protein